MKSFLMLAGAAVVAAVCYESAVADDGQDRPGTPQPIELSGRLHRPAKWYPQLELIPPARNIERFDLKGDLLRDIEEGTPIRVRGAVRSFLHRGSTDEDLSPFPPQWTILLDVTEVTVLDDPLDVLRKPGSGKPCEEDQQQRVQNREKNRKAPDLAGRWLMTLPAGFEHRVRLEPMGDNRFRIDIKDKGVVLEGIYKRCGDRLVIVKPDDERMTAFEWRIVNGNVLLLVDQRRPSPNGGNYIDATLSRLKSGKPSAARGQ